MSTHACILAGVGGQGVVSAGRLLGTLLTDEGLDVRVSEVHGMSQRGGSVVTHVRWGERVYSPVIGTGEADYLLGFEPTEALRHRSLLRPDAYSILSSRPLGAPVRLSGPNALPGNVLCLDAYELAERAGSARALNPVLLGAFSRLLPFPESAWLRAMEQVLPAARMEINLKAFTLGRTIVIQ